VSRTIDRTQERLALLVRAGEMFHRSLEVDETLDNVAQMAVESFADLCLFDLIDEQSDRLYVTAGAHRDPSMDKLLKNVGSSLLYDTGLGVHPAVRVTETGIPFFVPVFDDEEIRTHAASEEHARFMRRMRYRSKIVVPVVAQSHIFGALTFVRTTNTEPFDEHDVRAAQELGRRAGLAVANAKQYHREQYVAATLQRAFLSQDFPKRNGLVFHGVYRPGQGDAQLGGDWYDAFETRDGSIIVTIGDVTGKGIEAARLMVQLRQSVRIAATFSLDPGEILRIVNEALLFDRTDALATALVCTIGPDTRTVCYASAGHPPALLRWKGGALEMLGATAPPLGVASDMSFEVTELRIDDEALLVLYTDGVTEVTHDPIAGEAMLRALVTNEAVLEVANPARYIERAVARGHAQDDVAIMTLRFGETKSQWRFDVGDPAAAYAIKRGLFVWLHRVAEATAEEMQACEVIFSELIGNAVRHAPGPLSLSASVEDGEVVLHMIDEGPGFDHVPSLPSDLWAESGRGLFLISELSNDIRASRLPGYGSHVRVTLPLRVRREAPDSIPALTRC
jgi:serine phosphatase RsbU (regulator of sigma subunit)/anti-sigma regulatory factor (Ser/Thr protein kinase)